MPILRVPIGGILPAGHYYVDVEASWVPRFEAWVEKNKSNVKVTSTQVTEGALGSPTMTLFVFVTHGSLTWDGPNFPHAIPAGQTVTSTDDIYQVPKVPDPLDQLFQGVQSIVSGAPRWVLWGAGGAAAALVVWSAFAAGRRRKNGK